MIHFDGSSDQNHVHLLYIGGYTTKLYRDYDKPIMRIPIKQPGFNGKYPAVFFFGCSFVFISVMGDSLRRRCAPKQDLDQDSMECHLRVLNVAQMV